MGQTRTPTVKTGLDDRAINPEENSPGKMKTTETALNKDDLTKNVTATNPKTGRITTLKMLRQNQLSQAHLDPAINLSQKQILLGWTRLNCFVLIIWESHQTTSIAHQTLMK